MLIVIALIWLAGTNLRIYRQARFYQIEEYKSGRYLRWLFAQRDRWLPTRPLIAFAAGIVMSFILAEAPGEFLLGLIGILSAGAAILPPREKEVKKRLRRTARVKRMLAAAFILAVLLLWAGFALISILPNMVLIRYFATTGIGFLLWLIAPLLLIAGNLVMTPVEAFFRQRFIRQAKKNLEEVHPTVIGVTGSYGKTSTKLYLSHILNGRYKAYPTPKSYNTLMGVCIAINNDIANNHSVDYFICEMGAYVPGEIKRICDLTHPHIGLVIEVGPQHLERFGSLENVATAKYEIIKALPPDGLGVFNWDNPHVREMYERGYPQHRLAISQTTDPANPPVNGPRFIASNITQTLDGLTFTVTDTQTGESERFQTALLGQHTVTNILMATAVAVYEGMSLRDVAWQVRTLQPAESRLVRQSTAEGITIINDAYSANPVGAAQSLQVLGMHTSGRRLLVTPGMVELGDLMETENQKLGRTAAQYVTDVILVGEKQTAPIKTGLIDAGFPADHLQTVETLAESIAWYQGNLKAGDTVLFLNDLPDTYL
ncbi:MAG: UDP-N-acetylmuramoyl-tripeptide--D-alanyl-D-alanine ligase [Anaerolineae bacterium]|nr:UDP-N-acetylmuramoyl-tripeptide--D-alanyl-D-alanine ligase [Anaerolineae bacterium]